MTAQSLPFRLAVEVIQAGGVIAYPTEGVYGLGCDPFDSGAVQRILAIKKRPVSAGLIVIGDSLEQVRPLMGKLSKDAAARLEASWPGAVTWVVPAAATAPDWITGGRDTVAVRVPDLTLARQLCAAAGMPLVSTSANRSGRPPLRSALMVRRHLRDEVDCIVTAAIGGARGPTEMRDAVTGKVLRKGQ